MKLRFMEGHYAGRIVEVVDSGMIIGRDKECDLAFDDEGVSRRHAKIFREGDHYVVQDMNSTNGVRVNGAKIDGKGEVRSGDRIGLGPHVLLLTDDRDIMSPTKLAEKQQARPPAEPQAPQAAPATPAPPAAAAPAPARRPTPVPAPPRSNNLLYVCLALAVLAGLWFMLSGDPQSPPAGNGQASHRPHSDPGSSDGLTTTDLGPEPAPDPATQPEPDPPISDPTPPPRPEPPPEEKPAGYYFVQSTPPGAQVSVDNTVVGSTPLIIHDMNPGVHNLLLRKQGYRDLKQAFYMPHTGTFTPHKLKPAEGVCELTSEPNHVTVWMGTQILGSTPLLLRDLAPGQYSLTFTEYGYETVERSVNISAGRPTTTHITLRPATGALAVATVPPGASVFIDNVYKGTTPTEGARDGRSQPLTIPGLKHGVHTAHIEYKGRRSPVRKVQVARSAETPIGLAIWIPNMRVRTIGGKEFVGMVKQKNALGDVVLAVTPTRDVELIATQIQDMQELSAAEADRLLQKVAPPK